jgi:hypothetical protein
MARQEGFEPPTDALEGRCSIQLSYCLIVVLGPGIEPGRHYRDFKSLVSTYFTIRACWWDLSESNRAPTDYESAALTNMS